ncbi:MAG: 4Fe-4S dicluster domain-containing protein [candidate division Zixibacteria bacterium]
MSDNGQSSTSKTSTIDFEFREKLDSIAEGFRHNYCYQCGACVADCPAGAYSERFNPRLIMLKAILGFEEELINPESEIWECTNCYTCSERCPQDVRPIDVIIAMKNLSIQEGKAPEVISKIYDSVLQSGITTKISSLVERRREELGLAPLKEYPVDDIRKILEDD